MQMSDVIADMLTRIRNANDAKHATVDIPASNMKKAIAEILLNEGYIKGYQVLDDGKQVGLGTHKDLLESCDVYREICYSQLSKEEANGNE